MGDGWSLSMAAGRPAGTLPQLRTVEARTQVAAMAERRGPPETREDETTGLGANTTLKGKGGGLPEDSPGPPGEPGGTAAVTADEGPPAWGAEGAGPHWARGGRAAGRRMDTPGAQERGDETVVGRRQAEDTACATPHWGQTGRTRKGDGGRDKRGPERDGPRMVNTAGRPSRRGT